MGLPGGGGSSEVPQPMHDCLIFDSAFDDVEDSKLGKLAVLYDTLRSRSRKKHSKRKN